MNKLSENKRSPPLIPVWIKLCLTIEEAAAYSGIGEHKLREIAKDPNNNKFVLHVGTKILFQRVGFEQYVAGLREI